MEHFSDRLRFARQARQLTQAELARASGLSQGAISSYETGSRKSTTGLIQLAQALKVNPVWLIRGTGHMELDLAVENATRLQENQPQATTAAWPFTTVQPDEYWSLTHTQRHVIEEAVAAMIAVMSRENEKI